MAKSVQIHDKRISSTTSNGLINGFEVWKFMFQFLLETPQLYGFWHYIIKLNAHFLVFDNFLDRLNFWFKFVMSLKKEITSTTQNDLVNKFEVWKFLLWTPQLDGFWDYIIRLNTKFFSVKLLFGRSHFWDPHFWFKFMMLKLPSLKSEKFCLKLHN